MRSARTALFGILVLWLAIGCGAPGVPPSSPQAPAPSPSTTEARQASASPSPTRIGVRASPTAPPPRPSPSPSPSPTPRRRVIFSKSMGTPVAPPPQPSPPRSWPGGFSVAPNWIAFQPISHEEPGSLENVVWFTDGQQWIGPFSLEGCDRIWSCEPYLIYEQGVAYGCVRDLKSETLQFICLTPLPAKPMPALPVREVQCDGDLFAETVRCPLPAGMPVPEVRLPNAFFGEDLCEDCWLTLRILAPAGSPAMLAVENWEPNTWSEEEIPEIPPAPNPALFILEEGGARARPLIPPEAREQATRELTGLHTAGRTSLGVIGFSPDGRFLLVDDGPRVHPADWNVLWIVSWPEGKGVSLAGIGEWLRPDPEYASKNP